MFKRKNKVSVCIASGERKENPECIKLGDCSWFRHSQDGLAGGAYPPGYTKEAF